MEAQTSTNCGNASIEPTQTKPVRYVNPPSTPTAATISLSIKNSMFALADVDTFLPRIDDPTWPAPENDELDNPIHPIFAEEKWQGMRHEVLKPVLRLASLILLSAGSLEYLYAAMLSPLQDVPYANATKEQPRTFKSLFRKRTSLTRGDVSRIKTNLVLLGDLLTFQMTEEQWGAAALCVPQLGIPADSIRGPNGQRWEGIGSQIKLRTRTYDLLCDLHDSLLSGDTEKREQYLGISVGLAATLLHELAHAVIFARFGETRIGFEDQWLSEDGFDWENCFFGGMLRIDESYSELSEYPSPMTFDHYMSNEVRGGGMFVACAPPQDVEIIWKIAPSYIDSLFRKSFWEHTVPGRGAAALMVPKFMGYRGLPSAERGFCKCFSCLSTEAMTKAFVDAGNCNIDHDALVTTLDKLHGDFERRCAEKNRSANTHARASISTGAAHELASALGLNSNRMSNVSDTVSDAPREHSSQLDEDVFLTHCARMDWKMWPWGPSEVRLHGASRDPQTYAVPEGYVSLLDGTLVRADWADWFEQQENVANDESIDAIALLLVKLKKADADGSKSEEAKLRSRKFCAVLSEILDSEEPAMWRIAAAVFEDLID